MGRHVLILNRWDDEFARYHLHVDHERHRIAYITTRDGLPVIATDLAEEVAVVEPLDHRDDVLRGSGPPAAPWEVRLPDRAVRVRHRNGSLPPAGARHRGPATGGGVAASGQGDDETMRGGGGNSRPTLRSPGIPVPDPTLCPGGRLSPGREASGRGRKPGRDDRGVAIRAGRAPPRPGHGGPRVRGIHRGTSTTSTGSQWQGRSSP